MPRFVLNTSLSTRYIQFRNTCHNMQNLVNCNYCTCTCMQCFRFQLYFQLYMYNLFYLVKVNICVCKIKKLQEDLDETKIIFYNRKVENLNKLENIINSELRQGILKPGRGYFKANM